MVDLAGSERQAKTGAAVCIIIVRISTQFLLIFQLSLVGFNQILPESC